MSKRLTLQEMMIRGSIGKLFCIKHYNWGIIKTKFPDMTRIIASPGQRKCRDLFREAVAYAKTVIIDKEKKKEWQKRLKKKNSVYNAAVKAFMLKEKLDKERAEMLTRQLIRKAFKNELPVNLANIANGKANTAPEESITSTNKTIARPKCSSVLLE